MHLISSQMAWPCLLFSYFMSACKHVRTTLKLVLKFSSIRNTIAGVSTYIIFNCQRNIAQRTWQKCMVNYDLREGLVVWNSTQTVNCDKLCTFSKETTLYIIYPYRVHFSAVQWEGGRERQQWDRLRVSNSVHTNSEQFRSGFLKSFPGGPICCRV